MIIRKVYNRLHYIYWYYINKMFYKQLSFSSIVKKPLKITPQFLELGKLVYIEKGSRIEGVKKYNDIYYTPRIIINNGVTIQQNLHLTCAVQIEIGCNTALASNVTITDINHPYEDIHVPIEQQDIRVSPVSIGRDSKIYNNSVILPGVKIGNHVVIGANSVVNKSIPDYCIAVGAPAKIIKRYCHESNTWKRTNDSGDFIN